MAETETRMTAQGNHGSSIARPTVLAFDFNQTLIDFDALRPIFAQLFHDAAALDEWFSLLLHYSTVVTLTDSYSDFGRLGKAVFSMLAEGKGLGVSEEDRSRVFRAMLLLPAHPDVPESLGRLRAAGFRMVVLTNSPHASVDVQIRNAGIAQYFDEVISVDSVRRFKPDLEVYRYAARHLGVATNELMLIAAHAWDVHGAMRAGCRAAFVARQGRPLFPLGPKPEISAPDLKTVADAILQ
jgi:2-haloacid dehalogenase